MLFNKMKSFIVTFSPNGKKIMIELDDLPNYITLRTIDEYAWCYSM
jgi:hypothetical protein